MQAFTSHLKLLAFASFATATVLSGERPAQAILTYYIYERGSDVVIEANGSLLVPASSGATSCSGGNGRLNPGVGLLCTGAGTGSDMLRYNFGLQPTTTFGTGSAVNTADASGTRTLFNATIGVVALHSSYVSGSPIQGDAIFANSTLSGTFGITTTGLLGTWTLNGTQDTIQVIVGNPPASVPGPLPLLGAAAAFCYSRRLRRRVSLNRSASPSTTSISA
jgi:hypothetical protein